MQQQKSNVIDINTIIITLKKNFKLMLVWTFIGLLVSIVISVVLMTPKYSSTVDLLVNQKNNNVQSQYVAQQADLQAINTYKDILKKSVILEPVLQEIQKRDNYQGSLSDLQNSISVSNEVNSQVLSIEVIDSNPYVASDIANAIGKEFTQKIKKMMKVDNVTIVNRANVNVNPISPNKKINALLGIIVGAVIGVIISIVKELRDTTVKDSEYLSRELNLTVLGNIYHISNKNKDYRIIEVIDQLDSVSNRRV
ncbi:YveK family protein [Lactobacillus sp. AN1001]